MKHVSRAQLTGTRPTASSSASRLCAARPPGTRALARPADTASGALHPGFRQGCREPARRALPPPRPLRALGRPSAVAGSPAFPGFVGALAGAPLALGVLGFPLAQGVHPQAARPRRAWPTTFIFPLSRSFHLGPPRFLGGAADSGRSAGSSEAERSPDEMKLQGQRRGGPHAGTRGHPRRSPNRGRLGRTGRAQHLRGWVSAGGF